MFTPSLPPTKAIYESPRPHALQRQCYQTFISANLINEKKRYLIIIYMCIFLICLGQESSLIQPTNLIHRIHLQSPEGILFYISLYRIEYLHTVED